MRIGIDIGSTAAKAAVLDGDDIAYTVVVPTGFNGVDAAMRLADEARVALARHADRKNGVYRRGYHKKSLSEIRLQECSC